MEYAYLGTTDSVLIPKVTLVTLIPTAAQLETCVLQPTWRVGQADQGESHENRHHAPGLRPHPSRAAPAHGPCQTDPCVNPKPLEPPEFLEKHHGHQTRQLHCHPRRPRENSRADPHRRTPRRDRRPRAPGNSWGS